MMYKNLHYSIPRFFSLYLGLIVCLFLHSYSGYAKDQDENDALSATFEETSPNNVQMIKEAYDELFYIDTYRVDIALWGLIGVTTYSPAIAKVDSQHVFYDFITEREPEIRYLLSHFIHFDVENIAEDNQKILRNSKEDSIAAHREFIEKLSTHKPFNKYLLDWYTAYLNEQGKVTQDDKPQEKIHVTQDSLAAHTARFYYAIDYNEGSVSYSLCISRNGYRDLEPEERQGHLEALAYSVFSGDLRGSQELYNISRNYMEEINNEITEDMDDPVEYARHRMYEKLTSNQKFVDITVKELKESPHFPIELVDTK